MKKEEKIIVDMELMVKYVKLQEYYRELWDQYVEVCSENNRLKAKLRIKRGLEYLPPFPEV